MPVLREAIAAHQRRCYGLDGRPGTEVLVTAGATEALAATILALVDDGDEVVTFEPYYDAYAALVARAGGVHRTVPLRFPDWRPDPDELAAAVTDRTRRHPRQLAAQPDRGGARRATLELDRRARRAARCDHRDRRGLRAPHVRRRAHADRDAAGRPERTISISSGGKTFSTTGWKIGWITGPGDARHRGPRGQAVPHLRERRAVPARDRHRPRPARRGSSRMPRRPSRESATCSPPGSRRRASRSRSRRRVLRRRGCRAARRADGAVLCRELPERAGVVGVPVSAFVHPDRQRRLPQPRAVRVLQAPPTCSRRRRRGSRGSASAADRRSVTSNRRSASAGLSGAPPRCARGRPRRSRHPSPRRWWRPRRPWGRRSCCCPRPRAGRGRPPRRTSCSRGRAPS